jgi:uncharacterized membrane protein SpoIIM required for sporulation
LKQRAFEALHRARWDDFEALLAQAERARRRYRLDRAAAAETFIASYRALCRDLSIAKARGYSPTLIDYLNDLVTRGHNVVYARRSGFVAAALVFLAYGFPRLIRTEAGYVAVSLLAFAGAWIAIGAAVLARPELVYSVLTPDVVAGIEAMYDPGAERLGQERGAASDFMMFGYYIWNNVSIGFRTFATGLLAGIGTLFILVYNGVVLGAISVHLVTVGYGSTFLPFVIGHGALELTAIVLCGAAGLRLGHALVAPGRLPRRQALVVAARIGVRVLLGATIMMTAAAFVEAFWSAMRWPGATMKYVVGSLLWAAVLYYFLFVGRGRGPVAA